MKTLKSNPLNGFQIHHKLLLFFAGKCINIKRVRFKSSIQKAPQLDDKNIRIYSNFMFNKKA